MNYEFKSCFVKQRHLDKENSCRFCNKKIYDIRDQSSEEIEELDYQNVCVQTNGNQLVDSRGLVHKIKGAIERARCVSTGFRLVYLLVLFVSMTIFTSCYKHVIAGTYTKKEKRKSLPQVGFVSKTEVVGNQKSN